MAPAQLGHIQACVFDAYGTLFDFNSAVERCRDVLGDKTDELSAVQLPILERVGRRGRGNLRDAGRIVQSLWATA
jgi:FMN phosphatase YigB (HAD superfamily)